jgi:tetratricopeptide (TPR) repeat protein
LRNAIDWSWSLLAAWEQGAMVQCSVFEGGFDLAAAEAVLDLNEWPEAPPILDVVQSLVDKSLLRTWLPLEQPRLELEEPHFGMYVSIREYAREKLHQLGTPVERAAEDRHGDHFSTFGTDDAIEALSRHHGGRRRQALMLEVDNLVAGCRRAIGHGRTDAAVASFRAAWEVLDLQGPVTLANELASALLAMPGLEGRPLLVALTTAALALQRAGRTDEARACLERGLVLALELPDRRWEGRLLGQRATLQRDQGRVDQALQDFNAGLALHRETADRRAEGAILGNLGNLYLEQGRMAKRASVTRRR